MTAAQTAMKRAPFFSADAERVGMNWDMLQTRNWMRLSRGQYAWAGLARDFNLILAAVVQRIPPSYAFSGLTAAWLLGLDVSPCDPVEVTIGREVPVRARAGIKLSERSCPISK